MIPLRGAGAGALNSMVEQMQRLGFTEHEARAYIALLGHHPATAYEVSKLSGLPRPNAYGAMEGLAKKGAAQPVSAKPVRYVPYDPDTLLGRIAQETSDRCQTLAGELSSIEAGDTPDYVWHVTGEGDIRSKIDEMIDGARRHVWIEASARSLAPHRVRLEEAAERGVEVLLVLFGEESDAERFRSSPLSQVYLHEGSGIVIARGDHMITLTVDFETALVANTGDSGYGGFTRSRPIVQLADSLIRHEVYLAEIFQRFGLELGEAFGPALLSLRERYLPRNQIRALKRRLASARVPSEKRGRAGVGGRSGDRQ